MKIAWQLALNTWIKMRLPITLTVSACSTTVGYFIGIHQGEERSVGRHFPLNLIKSAFAKSSNPGESNSDLPQPHTGIPTEPTPVNTKPKAKGNNVNTVTEIVKYGFPSMDNLRSYEDFILSYDKRNRVAHWVLEHLTPEKVQASQVSRSTMKFHEDESVHVYHRATNDDYKQAGYDRGHLAAAANHRHSGSAMLQTFLLSNVAPQVGEGFNRDAWNELEKYTRSKAKNNPNVYVCTGPLYLPRVEADTKMYIKYEVIGKNHVAVPTHFFKVLLIENAKGYYEIQSFVMPNQKLPKGDHRHWAVPLETIERASGLTFFGKVPKERLKKLIDVGK